MRINTAKESSLHSKSTENSLHSNSSMKSVNLTPCDELRLKRYEQTGTGGMLPCHAITVHDQRILIANYLSSTLASIPILPTGALNDDPTHCQLISFKQTTSLGPHERQERSHPHCVVQFEGEIIVNDLGSDLLRRFAMIGDEMRALGEVVVPPGDGPRHTVSTKDRLYVVNELSNTVSVFSHATSSSPASPSTITPLQTGVSTVPPKPFVDQTNFSTWHASAIAIHSSTLYVTNRAEWDGPLSATGSDTIVIFQILPDGLLDPTPQFVEVGGRTPRHLSISKDGKYVAVALQDGESAIVIYERTDGGDLVEIVRMGDAGRPGCVIWDE